MDTLRAAEGLNFELPEEIRMLKDTVRKFVDRELIPIERTARENNKLKPDVRAHLTTKANELGLAGYDVPQPKPWRRDLRLTTRTPACRDSWCRRWSRVSR